MFVDGCGLTTCDLACFGVAAGLAGTPATAGAAMGILTSCWHLGHLPDFPAMLSGTFRLCPHWQVTRIGMLTTFIGKNSNLICTNILDRDPRKNNVIPRFFSQERQTRNFWWRHVARKLLSGRSSCVQCRFGVLHQSNHKLSHLFF